MDTEYNRDPHDPNFDLDQARQNFQDEVTQADIPQEQPQYTGYDHNRQNREEAFTTPVEARDLDHTPVATASAAPPNVPVDQYDESMDISAGEAQKRSAYPDEHHEELESTQMGNPNVDPLTGVPSNQVAPTQIPDEPTTYPGQDHPDADPEHEFDPDSPPITGNEYQ